MDDSIHINISLGQTDTHYISGHFVRIWPHLLATVNWIFKNPKPGTQTLSYGIGMTCVNNLAIAVEGFIADLAFEHIENNSSLKHEFSENIDRMTWKSKLDLYNKLFNKKIEDYPGYDGISVLLDFRNNLAHGRKYVETTEREKESEQFSLIKSENVNYQTIREYLIKKHLLKDTIVPSNSTVPWKPAVIAHFAGLVRYFLQNQLRENESEYKLGIEAEFKIAYSL